MAQGWAWLQRGVLLTMICGRFAEPPPEIPPERAGCSLPVRVLVAKRSIAAGDPVDRALSSIVFSEGEEPGDALDVADAEWEVLLEEADDNTRVAGIAGITIPEGEIIRNGWVMPGGRASSIACDSDRPGGPGHRSRR